MANRQKPCFTLLFLLLLFQLCLCKGSTDIELDARATANHQVDSLNLLFYLLVLSFGLLTTWLFKKKRLRYIHETGLACIYGMLMGALIRYAWDPQDETTHIQVKEFKEKNSYNDSLPPDILWLEFHSPAAPPGSPNKTYAYRFIGDAASTNYQTQKFTFDPELFFNFILPPIIFNAGFSVKRKLFFNNLGTILSYALLGTFISAFIFGILLYLAVQTIPSLASSFTLMDTMFFGSLISTTDPVTTLAIFHDLKVDPQLYALVFGESCLNDAVGIVMSGAIQDFSKKLDSDMELNTEEIILAICEFLAVFTLSLALGVIIGCITALVTKFTHVRDYPLIETTLFCLFSFASFLLAEATDLTGVVSVLFCGICQAHYTYNNLSPQSRIRTKQFFEILNFFCESFIFSYMGVSLFTFPRHNYNILFITFAFLIMMFSRACNIYPLSLILNLGRQPPLSWTWMHMIYFSGLRGAMAFALAIRNTLSEARQTMLTTTLVLVIFTVIVQGGLTPTLLNCFKIATGVEEEGDNISLGPLDDSSRRRDNTFLARVWTEFDIRYMKPFLTNSRPTLLETLPVCCTPIGRLLTTTQQMTQEGVARNDSDSDFCLTNDIGFGEPTRSSGQRVGSVVIENLQDEIERQRLASIFTEESVTNLQPRR